MRVSSMSILLVLVLFSAAGAAGLSGESRTYLRARETADDSKLVPLYEYLDFNIEGINSANASFHFGGWGRADIVDETMGKRWEGDIQYAYLSFVKDKANTAINLGRFPVFEGVAAEIVDGLYARTDLRSGFSISGFAGLPVETDFFEDEGEFIYGGRIQHEIPGLYRIGASYLREVGSGDELREEEGIDLWFRPVSKVELLGRSSYSSSSSGWREHDYRLSFGPFSDFVVSGTVSRVRYKDFFTHATSAAFRLQNGILDPDEKATILGGEVEYTMMEKVVLLVDYRNFDYRIAGSADYFGGRVSYRIFSSISAGLGYHRMDGDIDRLKYNEYRAYVTGKRGPVDATLDLFLVSYDQRINDIKNAVSVSLAAGYDISKTLRMGADVEYSRDPFFDRDWRFFLKLLYQFTTGKGGYKS